VESVVTVFVTLVPSASVKVKVTDAPPAGLVPFNTVAVMETVERRVKLEQEGKGDEWISQAIATRPFGRLLAPLDIAYAAAYFASSASECVTGSVLDLEQYPPGALTNS